MVGLGIVVVVVVVGVCSVGAGGDGCSRCGWCVKWWGLGMVVVVVVVGLWTAENFDGADGIGNDVDFHDVGCSGGVGIIKC